MKKLMITAAIVCAAAMVQASSFNWKVSSKESMYAANGYDSDTYFTGTAYLFDSASVTQQAVLDAFFADGSIASGYLSTGAFDDGDLSAADTTPNPFSWGEAGDTLNAYYAAIMTDGDQKYIFISEIESVAATPGTTETLTFKPEDASGSAPFESTTYSTTGWYTQSVPEPTSGLLLLLGVAGLALRRRRA